MLLAADVGGTKTLVGLFRADRRRPVPVVTRVYATPDFASLDDVVRAFFREHDQPKIDAFCAGVAGPVTGIIARLTNVPMVVDAKQVSTRLGDCPVALLNDLEAMAYAVTVLRDTELHSLYEPSDRTHGNAALIAAGTGLGESVLHLMDGDLVPSASEGGHADFAARTPRELAFVSELAPVHGRVDVERVLSGHGIANLFRFTHGLDDPFGSCDAIERGTTEEDLPAAVSHAALDGSCRRCVDALDMFVSAYGAEAGNLALRAMAFNGVYIGGGIAPKILAALTKGAFMDAFLDKAPMHDLVSRVPVRVILNPDAVLVGASVHAAAIAARPASTA